MQVALQPLDIALVVIYLVGVAAVGLWLSRGVKTGKDLFLGGRSLPWWAVGTSLVVSDIGAKDMVGLAGDGYRWGMVMTNFDFVGCIFPVLVAAFIFMPYFWMAGVYTVPEYLGRRYNTYVRTFFAVIWALFMVGTLGVIFVSAATMFENLLGANYMAELLGLEFLAGWDFWIGVALTAVLVGAYTTIGGLKAVVVTDFVSCIVLIAGATLICVFGLHEVGGWSGLQESIAAIDWGPEAKPQWTQNHFDLILPGEHPEFPWLAVMLGLGFVLGPAYWIGNQAIVQRTLGTRSQNEARASYILCAVIKLVFPLLLVVPGLIGLALFHEQMGVPEEWRVEDPEAQAATSAAAGGASSNDASDAAEPKAWDGNSVLPLVVAHLLPTGILGIVLGAFAAGVMSNLDSYVNSASTLCVTDLYRPFLRPNASDRETLIVGRWLVVVFLVAGMATSYLVKVGFSSVFEAFQTFLTFFQGALLALLLCGMLSRRVTQWGGVAGMLVGVGVAGMLHYFATPYLWVAWWSFVAALATTIGVSLLTRPYDDERLRGLVYWLPATEEAPT